MKKIALVGLALTGVLASCGSQTSSPMSSSLNSISTEDKDIFQNILKNRSKNDGEIVFITGDGKVLSSNLELSKTYNVYKSNSNSYTDIDGRLISYTPIAEKLNPIHSLAYPCTIDPTGPYYRVKTKPGLLSTLPGSGLSQFSYASANLNLPSGADVNINSTSNAYIMFGGWGRASTPSQSTPADVGLQYNTAYSGNPQADYSIFMVSVDKSTGMKTFTTGQRYKPNSLKMVFYVYADNILALRTEGTPEDSTKPIKVTTFLSAPGWKFSGQDNVVKRLTSITNYTSGQYLRNVEWSDMYLGRQRTASSVDGVSDNVNNLHAWGSYGGDIDSGTDGKCSSPTPAIYVEDYAPALEIVSIY